MARHERPQHAIISEEQLQALPDAAFVTGPDGIIAAWNGAAGRLLGHPRTAAVGSPCATLLQGIGPLGVAVCANPCAMIRDALPSRRAALRRAESRRHPDMLARTRSGERMALSVVALPVTMDGAPMLLHLLRDEPSAERDGLTGTLNRDAFAMRACDEQHRSGRVGSTLSLALVDIDGLKNINDQRGHGVGDQALVTVATALRNGRRTDLVGRWGGDEFAVLFPDTRPPEATTRMRRVLEAVQRAGSSNEPPLSFSAGVIELEPAVPLERAIGRADRAMYAAKRAGRSRVIAHKPVS